MRLLVDTHVWLWLQAQPHRVDKPVLTCWPTLPPLHRHPLDRLLVGQARLEGLEIVTADPAFEAYGVAVRWAAAG